MGCQESFKKRLRERGFRLTPQRELVLDALHDLPGHATAEQVLSRVRQVSAAMDVSTIYRTMELLRELGFVAELDHGDGQLRYELLSAEGPHHHLKCSRCGRLFRVEEEEVQPLLQAVTQRHQFQLQPQHLVINGICPDCQDS